jgi:archaemetzincin
MTLLESPSSMNLKKICIGVAPFGKVSDAALRGVAAYIQTHLNLEAHILSPFQDPAYAYDQKRGQYNAAIILKALNSMPFDEGVDKVICVMDVDLFIPIFTHVLGEANEGGRYALASLYRLGKATDRLPASFDQIIERLVKVAVHELGHLFNMAHCLNTQCLMHYSGNLADLDRTSLTFCDYCSEFLAYSIRRERLLPYEDGSKPG